jgi:hypothetical protein
MAFIIGCSILSQGLFSALVVTISTFTIGTGKVIASIYNSQNPDAINFIKKLDIERRLQLIESVVKSINPNYTTNATKESELKIIEDYQPNVPSNPIELALMHLSEIIGEINNNLKTINKKVTEHQAKWFQSWRTLDINGDMEILGTNSVIMENRFRDFIRISSLLKH